MQPYHQVDTMVHQHMTALAGEAEARRLARRARKLKSMRRRSPTN